MIDAQVVLDGVSLPLVSHDRYACWEELKTVDLEMAARNLVREVPDKFKVWRARYAFDTMEDALYRRALAILNRGEAFQAAVLPSDRDELIPIRCFCVSLTPATFAFLDGTPVWHNLAFELREVEPHD